MIRFWFTKNKFDKTCHRTLLCAFYALRIISYHWIPAKTAQKSKLKVLHCHRRKGMKNSWPNRFFNRVERSIVLVRFGCPQWFWHRHIHIPRAYFAAHRMWVWHFILFRWICGWRSRPTEMSELLATFFFLVQTGTVRGGLISFHHRKRMLIDNIFLSHVYLPLFGGQFILFRCKTMSSSE